MLVRLERWEQYGGCDDLDSRNTRRGCRGKRRRRKRGEASIAKESKVKSVVGCLLLLTAAADDDADDGVGREMARANDDECPPYGGNRTADHGRRVSRHFWQR